MIGLNQFHFRLLGCGHHSCSCLVVVDTAVRSAATGTNVSHNGTRYVVAAVRRTVLLGRHGPGNTKCLRYIPNMEEKNVKSFVKTKSNVTKNEQAEASQAVLASKVS